MLVISYNKFSLSRLNRNTMYYDKEMANTRRINFVREMCWIRRILDRHDRSRKSLECHGIKKRHSRHISEPAHVFYFNGVDSVRRHRDLALWSSSSLANAATATAKNADQHITRRNVGARTYVLSRRYGGANCNLCLIAIVVGAPRQRELCRRRSFLRFKTFQECHHHSQTENTMVAPCFSLVQVTSPWIAHRTSLSSICENSKCRSHRRDNTLI